MSKFDSQLDRMKAMMNYGLKTESKPQYNSIEYQREGADGKMYGIVREGTKYYIKVSEKTSSPLKENFDYIGGFRNRKDFEYDSYANALKNFEMKMTSIKESKRDLGQVITESWSFDNKKSWTTETTQKMRDEIERQRQIMSNAKNIFESNGKPYATVISESCSKVDKECAATQKNNIKKESDGCGDSCGNGGDPFNQKVDKEFSETQKSNGKDESNVVKENEQVLGWNDNADYLDTSHGTEVGDGSPFNKEPNTESEMDNGVIDEGVAMHNTDNQNSPAVGTGEVGDDAPFEEKAKNELQESTFCEEEDVEMGEEEPMEGEMDVDLEIGEEEPEFDAEEEPIEDEIDGDMESRISAMEDLLSKIAEKLGVSSFEDDELYDEEPMDDEESMDDFGGEEDEFDFEDDDEDYEVYESANFRRSFNKLNEDRMDYFGKHPAYQKEPMELPSNKHQEMPEYYDMNDDSVKNDAPFGKQIGDGAPFEIDPKTIENSIAESIKRIMKKKI